MAREIMLTPEDMRGKADTIRTLREQHIETMRKLTNLVYSLSMVWTGEAQTAFVKNYMGMQPTFESFRTAVGEFAALMDQHAARMEQTDRELAAKIKEL